MPDPRTDRFVRSHLKTRQLVLLVELGRHGSILHAAQAAHLTQPAASKLLADLEHALGVKLFERLPRGVAPTWYGEVMIRRAGAALAELDAGHQEVMELLSGLSGRVAVGSVLTPSATLLPAAVVALKARQPRVHVSITVDTSKLLTEQLRGGGLDLVIGRVLDSESAAQLSFEPLTDEPHSLIVRAGHPLAGRGDLSLAELARQSWILPPGGSILRDRLTALFLTAGLDQPQQAVETLSLPVVTSLLCQSDMVVALPQELVQPYLDTGLLTVLDFDLGLRMDAYGIVTRRGHQLSPGAELMLACLREVAQRRRDEPRP
ncbi:MULTISPECIES: LysR family transcriptional regulator [Roseateles]|uniref:LysR family transcriptional regulator n=1 Tax=Pelomonas caseinilytica TaxID=2906763 RepID=A0ABS8X925_9BURK|nr:MULTISPECIES: LysR family transcriptional regulator [unclassified Roseateles]MCE4537294.1 LysR family transcriptional regulator [Pelomonas sp. P7]HEV6965287.1 LysR family transcriptional regulator [Roseateles sp.]